MLKFKTSCAVLAYLSSNLLNAKGLSLFRYFEVGLRVCDIVVKKLTFAISSPDEFLLKTRMLNTVFLWLLRSLVGSLGRVYPSKQQSCQGPHQFQNFNFCAVVAPLVVRTKKQLNGNYGTILTVKFFAFWKLWPRSWSSNLKVGEVSPVPAVVAPMKNIV